jgi:hypothetical protein
MTPSSVPVFLSILICIDQEYVRLREEASPESHLSLAGAPLVHRNTNKGIFNMLSAAFPGWFQTT